MVRAPAASTVGCAKSPRDTVEPGTASGAILRTRPAARIDYSPNRPSISPTSPPQSAGNKPFFTYRWKLLYGQSQVRVTYPCFTGLKWT